MQTLILDSFNSFCIVFASHVPMFSKMYFCILHTNTAGKYWGLFGFNPDEWVALNGYILSGSHWNPCNMTTAFDKLLLLFHK